jgi:hypothetical protein
MVFSISESKRRHPHHGQIVKTAKKLIIECSELRVVTERLKKLGPDMVSHAIV